MTTPDTSAVRAWARENGLEVSDRGRLSAEVRAAYAVATAGSAQASGTAKGAARRTARGTARGPASPAGRTPDLAADLAADLAVGAPTSQEELPVGPASEGPATAAPDDRRLDELADQVAALTARVARLEESAARAAAAPEPAPAPAPRASLFRRRRG